MYTIIILVFIVLVLEYNIIIGFFPIGQLLLFKLENKYQSISKLPENIDGLIILGGPSSAGLTAIYDQVNFNDGGERLTEAVLVIKKINQKK